MRQPETPYTHLPIWHNINDQLFNWKYNSIKKKNLIRKNFIYTFKFNTTNAVAKYINWTTCGIYFMFLGVLNHYNLKVFTKMMIFEKILKSYESDQVWCTIS